MPVCLIGLGSNEGNRRHTLEAAAACLVAHPRIHVAAVSSWRETASVGGPAGQTPFLNGALTAETALPPQDLLALLQQIEHDLGRRRGERWGPRPIDLDLLLYDEATLNTPLLELPHPRMAWRRFVIEPAAEVAATMVHPTTGWTVARLLEHLNTAASYVAITGGIAAGKSHLARRLAEALPAQLIAEEPDWPRLDAFYADPAGQGWPMELEFLNQRAGLLERLEKQWAVSDFWFDQSPAFARAWLPPEQLPAFIDRWKEVRRGVPRPKLIVLLDAPAETLLARLRSRGRPCEQRLTEDQLERIRQAIREQTRQGDVGPVLYLSNAGHDAAFAEVLAAVRGME